MSNPCLLNKSCARIKNISDVHEDGRLVRILHLLDTEDWSVHLIVDPWQVGDGGTLTHSTEFIINGTVAEAYPSLVCAEIGNGNATQMRADSRAHNNIRVSSICNNDRRVLVKLSRFW